MPKFMAPKHAWLTFSPDRPSVPKLIVPLTVWLSN
jgi:hypothetical protein